MGLDPQLLGKDEVVVLHLRTHVKALIVPALLLVVVSVLTGFAFALLPQAWRPVGSWVVALVALVALGVWVVVPFLRWMSSTYTFTNRRIITRRGILVKSGHDLPLTRINNVAYRRGPIDQLLGCGTLVLTTAADQPVTLEDIPDVERVHVVMTELLFSGDDPIHQPTLRDE
ncbi:PH domain-containing protein [Propionicimonas sp.]|uniref:PH domain-containing protein n=1 Tax=Propionicimonas sp. TaxID=1955623 RepID=UPI0039E44EEB